MTKEQTHQHYNHSKKRKHQKTGWSNHYQFEVGTKISGQGEPKPRHPQRFWLGHRHQQEIGILPVGQMQAFHAGGDHLAATDILYIHRDGSMI